jgi:hypothetical protein
MRCILRGFMQSERGLIGTSGTLVSVALASQTVRIQFSSNPRQTPDDIDVRRRER